jgi:hypothetical protein
MFGVMIRNECIRREIYQAVSMKKENSQAHDGSGGEEAYESM